MREVAGRNDVLNWYLHEIVKATDNIKFFNDLEGVGRPLHSAAYRRIAVHLSQNLAFDLTRFATLTQMATQFGISRVAFRVSLAKIATHV